MDVREMADKYIRNVHDPLIDYEADIFIAGYNSACEWRNLDILPDTDEGYILVAFKDASDNDNIVVTKGFYDHTKREWVEYCQDEIYNPVAWMPLPKYTHKP